MPDIAVSALQGRQTKCDQSGSVDPVRQHAHENAGKSIEENKDEPRQKTKLGVGQIELRLYPVGPDLRSVACRQHSTRLIMVRNIKKP